MSWEAILLTKAILRSPKTSGLGLYTLSAPLSSAEHRRRYRFSATASHNGKALFLWLDVRH